MHDVDHAYAARSTGARFVVDSVNDGTKGDKERATHGLARK